MANVNPEDRNRGVYGKFLVQRADGDPTGKHAGCDYFVLDLVHDPHAKAALSAYARSCANEYPALASDLLKRIDTGERWRDLSDPITAAVHAQLDPLKDELIAQGRKLGPRCVTCRKREGIEALADQCEECARGDAMLEQRSW